MEYEYPQLSLLIITMVHKPTKEIYNGSIKLTYTLFQETWFTDRYLYNLYSPQFVAKNTDSHGDLLLLQLPLLEECLLVLLPLHNYKVEFSK